MCCLCFLGGKVGKRSSHVSIVIKPKLEGGINFEKDGGVWNLGTSLRKFLMPRNAPKI